MKLNPKVNEYESGCRAWPRCTRCSQRDSVQGAMALMYNLQVMLAEIAGFAAVTLQCGGCAW